MKPNPFGRLLGATVVTTIAAGCSGTSYIDPGILRLSAAWQPWGDDPLPQLMLHVWNEGGRDEFVGPGGLDVTVTGPSGDVPLFWGETPFARPVHPGAAVAVGLHPRASPEGQFGLSIDHAWGQPETPTPGRYADFLAGQMVNATLKG